MTSKEETKSLKLSKEEASYRLKNAYKSLGLGSVFDVLQLSRESFVARYGEELGGKTEAVRVYDWAVETGEHVAQRYHVGSHLKEERLGNGVGMRYGYEACSQRLSEKEAIRLSDKQSLQYLHYTYDPVGNILSIEDKAKAVEHFKNEKTEAINYYKYDSFYQLHRILKP